MYHGPTKLGTHIRLPDGREATVVFNGLCGVGVKFGLHDPPEHDFTGTSGDLLAPAGESPARNNDWPWAPEAYLRDDWPGADLECVGEVCDVI